MVHPLAQRPVLVAAAEELIHHVQERRDQLPAHAAERDFYLGVEAAAEEVVHPELTMTRTPRWLRLESSAFQDGYERTRIMIATMS
jgi:hypothetical protein